MTHEIAEQAPDLEGLVLVGIQSGGVDLAARLAKLFTAFYDVSPPTGAIDITFYRDDLDIRLGKEYGQPKVRETDLPFDINGKTVVLVDDVLYTGRTIRAAIDALFDYGRPLAVRLAVLVDRGHRDLPIRPDFVRQERADQPQRAGGGAPSRGRWGGPGGHRGVGLHEVAATNHCEWRPGGVPARSLLPSALTRRHAPHSGYAADRGPRFTRQRLAWQARRRGATPRSDTAASCLRTVGSSVSTRARRRSSLLPSALTRRRYDRKRGGGIVGEAGLAVGARAADGPANLSGGSGEGSLRSDRVGLR